MPRSATGGTEAAGFRSAGFTLIEILVVVAIAAILATLVILRLGVLQSPDSPELQLRRLAAQIEQQCEQALFQSHPRGLRLSREGYDFWQLLGEGWAPLPDRARSWPADLKLRLVVEGHPVNLGQEAQLPQLVCQPLGELTPFDLQLEGQKQRATLSSQGSSLLVLQLES